MNEADSKRKRYSITLTKYYEEKLNELVDKGIYLNLGNVVREGLRLVIEKHKADLD